MSIMRLVLKLFFFFLTDFDIQHEKKRIVLKVDFFTMGMMVGKWWLEEDSVFRIRKGLHLFTPTPSLGETT